jgi:hypothetical protein
MADAGCHDISLRNPAAVNQAPGRDGRDQIAGDIEIQIEADAQRPDRGWQLATDIDSVTRNDKKISAATATARAAIE